MNYARSRLWLGMSTVGCLVVMATAILTLDLVGAFSDAFLANPYVGVAVAITSFFLLMVPFDFLGGFVLPRRYQRSQQSLANWLTRYAMAVGRQWLIYMAIGILLSKATVTFGMPGAVGAAGLAMFLMWIGRNMWVKPANLSERQRRCLDQSVQSVGGWGISLPRIRVVDHDDVGFTGGIVGLGPWTTIILPTSWLDFESERLAVILGRRALAVQSGSYLAGLLGAISFNLIGFWISAALGWGALGSLSWLISTMCWFTLWSFIGLLFLPTVSRNASLGMDQALAGLGVSQDSIISGAGCIDQLQDDEPSRPAMVEAIFHPIPSVQTRFKKSATSPWTAWQMARTTLFLSWGCLGLLPRAVHCNVGRPELWMMLPSD